MLLACAYLTASDILVSGLLPLLMSVSHSPADKSHMFGHGAQNVGALVAGTILVFSISLEVFRGLILSLEQKYWRVGS